MRALRIIVTALGVLALLALAYDLGAESIAAALARVSPAQFALICVLQGVNVVLDSYGWQYVFASDGARFGKLLAARCAGDAMNVLTALGSVGGEAVKAWVLRHEIAYEESVPSLILSKTAEVLAQTLLVLVAVLVALATGIVGPHLLTAMGYLLLAQVIGVGGFLAVQIAGVVGKAGRVLSWAGIDGRDRVQQLDGALRAFYRDHPRRFAVSVGLQFTGGLIGVAETLLILHTLGLPASLSVAVVVDALWSAVRFVTFFIPASLGPLETSTAAVFGALGLGMRSGLEFALVRRARQAVWIGIGIVVLMAMRPTRSAPVTAAEPRYVPAPK